MTVTKQDGIVLRLRMQQDLRLEYRCHTEVNQDFSNNGMSLGDKKHQWDTRLQQRVIRQEGDIAHIVTVSEPLGERPQEPIVSAQFQRQLMYSQMNMRGQMLESVGGFPALICNFPDEAVYPDFEWENPAEVYLPGMPQPGHCINKFRVGSVENVCGFECVRIEVSSTEASFGSFIPGSEQKAEVVMQSTGSIHFAPKLGLLVRIEQQTVSTPKIQTFSFRTVTKVVQELVKFDLPKEA